MLAKTKRTIFNGGDTSDTCGYILWCPDFTNQPTVLGSGLAMTGTANVFTWSSASPSLKPRNNIARPYGSQLLAFDNQGEPSPTAHTGTDPAAALLESQLVQDVRTLSSCIELTYTGSIVNSSGELAFLESIPLDAILDGGTETAPTLNGTMNVNDLFNYATTYQRLGVDTVRTLSIPTPSSSKFRTEDEHAIFVEEGKVSYASTIAKAQQPTFYGLAWRGVDVTTSPAPMSISLLKNIEWRPKPVSGLSHAPPVALNDGTTWRKALDSLPTGFNTRQVLSGAYQATKTVLAGAKMFYGPRRQVGQRLGYDGY